MGFMMSLRLLWKRKIDQTLMIIHLMNLIYAKRLPVVGEKKGNLIGLGTRGDPRVMRKAYVRLLRDNEAEVRIAAAGKVTKFSRILGPKLAIQHILPSVKHVRSALASVILGMAPILGKAASFQFKHEVFVYLFDICLLLLLVVLTCLNVVVLDLFLCPMLTDGRHGSAFTLVWIAVDTIVQKEPREIIPLPVV
uniref:Serine/threonine-protein phosphatase 2A 65 kDa regulatory subunit A beta isoform n=1 Tax=Tanacetum cinerariifolium TaxID=118510 RepID=A0A699IPY2_TANCI|nr:serine/threonine-protein phosphatase 2A 65 kDa regulatory subunit A beta isoform [Tanacetum cinerariifolium]